VPIYSDATSCINLRRLLSYIAGRDRSLIFFIGAGASFAGNTGMPSTPMLLSELLSSAIGQCGAFESELASYLDIVRTISEVLGFEITLNDLVQICPIATSRFYHSFASLEQKCQPNRVHTFLANWLASGGIVLTTNYDRLIEREWKALVTNTHVYYGESGNNSFEHWYEKMQKGGGLFKFHGSFDNLTVVWAPCKMLAPD
jgi:hypothetical protein